MYGSLCLYGGLALFIAGLVLPALPSHPLRARSRLDEFMPAWQFNEVHTIRIGAPPDKVFAAIRQVRADEIFLFRTLTWIRLGGRAMPRSILAADGHEPLIDVALEGGFVKLADDASHELVIGCIVARPSGARGKPSPEMFRTARLPPGFALAAMNFRLTAEGPGVTRLTTETRVFASSAAARRRFALYWRVIYPGSALIRRMWLRAIERRATA
jgi:hypothetical protein